MVPGERLELSRDNSQRLLRPQRLPISPSGLYEAANINVSSVSHKINIKIRRFAQLPAKVIFVQPITMRDLTLIFAFITFTLSASAQNADAILGSWANPSGEDHILIYKRGNKFFGRLDWIKYPNDEQGKPKTDKNNPDPKIAFTT